MWREMKIAFVIANLTSGGAERAVSNISLELQKNHDISIILFDAKNVFYPHGGKIVDVGIPPKGSKLGKLVNVVKRSASLKKIYKKEKFDAVFAFMEGAGIPSLLADKNTIVSVRDNPKSLPKIYSLIFPFLYRKSKKVVACANAIEQELVQSYAFSNTTTIHNIVDIDSAIQSSKATINHESKRPFILALGRLVPQKGFDYLIDAFASSHAKDNVDLLICGEGEEREKLQAMIDERGMSDKIILKGNVENPFAYYARADFYVLSSRHEGFPNILIEALACGCPCISFDCKTGPNEIIRNGENGLLVEAENVSALAEAMDRLDNDKALQTLFRKNANKSVAHLSPKVIAQKWVDLI